MTQLQAITPNGYTLTLTCHPDEVDQLQWILDADKWLKANGFTALPVPKSGGNWGGGKANALRHWIDIKNEMIYVYFGYVESKENSTKIRNEYLAKIRETTGIGSQADTETFGKDDKGRAIYTYPYPLKAWRGIVDALPTTEFEYKEAFKTRVEAALAKAQA